MKFLERALNELYTAAENAEEAPQHIENAIEILQDGLGHLGCQMASDEVIELINNLDAGYDIEPIIYELEVIQNEM